MKVMWTKKYAIADVGDTESELAQAVLKSNVEPLEDAMFDSVEEALDGIKAEEEKVGRIARVIKIGDVVYVRCDDVLRKNFTFKICLVEIAEEM